MFGKKQKQADSNFKEQFKAEYENFRRSLGKARILIVGATGVGKSTLCNLVFKQEIAKAGAGRPVTVAIDCYEHDLMYIYDSAGYENGNENQQQFNALIFDFIEKQDLEREPVDIIWYCVSAPAARFTDMDAELIRKIQSKGKPVATVLTQIDVATEEQCNDLVAAIRETFSRAEIFESSIDESIKVNKGLPELHTWTMEHLDASRQTAFISVSNRALDHKLAEGEKIINTAAVAAAGVAVSPIPGSDAALLLPIQTGMLAKLTSLWDLMSVSSLVSNIGVDLLLSNLGKMVAGNLLKCLPGGQGPATMINALVASSITWGIGSAFNQIAHEYYKRKLNGETIPFEEYFNTDFLNIAEVFIENYKNKKK